MNTFSQPPVFAYLETTVPVGMTLSDYRHSLPRAERSRFARLRPRRALALATDARRSASAVTSAPAGMC